MKRLINFVLPVQACNFHCHYCYIGQEGRANVGMGHLQYSPEHIQKAMTKERLGGICHINMCGLGETLLPEYSVELCKKMLENGHFVSIVTNGTVTDRIRQLLAFPEWMKQRMFFKFSFHWLELLRTNTLALFWENVNFVKKENVAFTVELTVNDACTAHIGEIQKSCIEHLGGGYCHVIESRNNNDGFSRLTKLKEAEHLNMWGAFQSPLFQFQQEHWMVKREEFCYAGDWAVSLNVESGWMMPCFAGGEAIQNIFENPQEPIHFMAIGHKCQWKHCYAAYILLTSGVIPELNTPVYAKLRECASATGGQWLSPDVRRFFSTKLAEENRCYSSRKKQWIDALTQIIYEGKYPKEEENRRLAEYLKEDLGQEGVKSVAVFGSEGNERWMHRVLGYAGINCKYGLVMVEARPGTIAEKLKQKVKYGMKRCLNVGNRLVLLNQEDWCPKVDLLIVCDTKWNVNLKKGRQKLWNVLVN